GYTEQHSAKAYGHGGSGGQATCKNVTGTTGSDGASGAATRLGGPAGAGMPKALGLLDGQGAGGNGARNNHSAAGADGAAGFVSIAAVKLL
ncbi:hypothetical protein ABT279_51000, partial [Amycolatopsis sp. NPDC000673]